MFGYLVAVKPVKCNVLNTYFLIKKSWLTESKALEMSTNMIFLKPYVPYMGFIIVIYGLTNHLGILIYACVYFEQNLCSAPSVDFLTVKPNCLGLKNL